MSFFPFSPTLRPSFRKTFQVGQLVCDMAEGGDELPLGDPTISSTTDPLQAERQAEATQATDGDGQANGGAGDAESSDGDIRAREERGGGDTLSVSDAGDAGGADGLPSSDAVGDAVADDAHDGDTRPVEVRCAEFHDRKQHALDRISRARYAALQDLKRVEADVMHELTDASMELGFGDAEGRRMRPAAWYANAPMSDDQVGLMLTRVASYEQEMERVTDELSTTRNPARAAQLTDRLAELRLDAATCYGRIAGGERAPFHGYPGLRGTDVARQRAGDAQQVTGASATQAATAADVATRAATEAATRAATEAATHAAVQAATRAATQAATRAAMQAIGARGVDNNSSDARRSTQQVQVNGDAGHGLEQGNGYAGTRVATAIGGARERHQADSSAAATQKATQPAARSVRVTMSATQPAIAATQGSSVVTPPVIPATRPRQQSTSRAAEERLVQQVVTLRRRLEDEQRANAQLRSASATRNPPPPPDVVSISSEDSVYLPDGQMPVGPAHPSMATRVPANCSTCSNHGHAPATCPTNVAAKTAQPHSSVPSNSAASGSAPHNPPIAAYVSYNGNAGYLNGDTVANGQAPSGDRDPNLPINAESNSRGRRGSQSVPPPMQRPRLRDMDLRAFEGTDGEWFDRWFEQDWMTYFHFVGLASMKDEMRAYLLRSKLGSKAQQYLDAHLSTEGKLSYERMVELLKARYSQRAVINDMKIRFQNRDREEGEPINEYADKIQFLYLRSHPGVVGREAEIATIERVLSGIDQDLAAKIDENWAVLEER